VATERPAARISDSARLRSCRHAERASSADTHAAW